MDSSLSAPITMPAASSPDRRGVVARIGAATSAAVGAISGVAPHVLHHVGPIAGAALLTGTGGTVLFGFVGFALTVPMLLQLKRRFATWLAPGIALAIFAAVFTVSTLWIGPAIRGEVGGGDSGSTPTDHASHH